MNLIGTVLRHYIVDMGLSIMFDNIKANIHINALKNDSIAYDQTFPFKCHIQITYGNFTVINDERVYQIKWIENCECLNFYDDIYTFRDEYGNIFKPHYEQVVRLEVVKHFDDEMCESYDNENWNICDNNGDD